MREMPYEMTKAPSLEENPRPLPYENTARVETIAAGAAYIARNWSDRYRAGIAHAGYDACIFYVECPGDGSRFYVLARPEGCVQLPDRADPIAALRAYNAWEAAEAIEDGRAYAEQNAGAR